MRIKTAIWIMRSRVLSWFLQSCRRIACLDGNRIYHVIKSSLPKIPERVKAAKIDLSFLYEDDMV